MKSQQSSLSMLFSHPINLLNFSYTLVLYKKLHVVYKIIQMSIELLNALTTDKTFAEHVNVFYWMSTVSF